MTQFKNKEISKEDVLKALESFNNKYPNPSNFHNWLDANNFKYVLEYNGKTYPPKQILSEITGIDVSEFSGGKETNNIFEKLGFTIFIKTHYWKIAPGDKARFWDRCKSDKNISVGWDKFGEELSEFINDYKEYVKSYTEKYKDKQGAQFNSQMDQLWQFINLQKGDIIIANKGIRSIVGVGKVSGNYQFRSDYDEYKHTILVDWFNTEEIAISDNAEEIVKSWPYCTLKELSESEFMTLTHNYNKAVGESIAGVQIIQLLQSKKQIMLFGPPGTGKTYNTKKIAVSLIDGFDDLEESDELPDAEADSEMVVPQAKGKDNTYIDDITLELVRDNPHRYDLEEIFQIICKCKKIRDHLEKQKKRGKKDPVATLKNTTKRRLHGHLQKKYRVRIEKDADGKYYIPK